MLHAVCCTHWLTTKNRPRSAAPVGGFRVLNLLDMEDGAMKDNLTPWDYWGLR